MHWGSSIDSCGLRLFSTLSRSSPLASPRSVTAPIYLPETRTELYCSLSHGCVIDRYRSQQELAENMFDPYQLVTTTLGRYMKAIAMASEYVSSNWYLINDKILLTSESWAPPFKPILLNYLKDGSFWSIKTRHEVLAVTRPAGQQ